MSKSTSKESNTASMLEKILAKALECPYPKDLLKNGYSFEALHPYFDEAGGLIYSKIRLKNISTGDKWIRPITYENGVIDFQEPDFADYGFEHGRPIYRLELLHKYPEALVYLVEGEKAADALNAYFEKNGCSNNYIATTSGAAKSYSSADFTPLMNRKVVCWGDNDEVGKVYIENATLRLIELGCDVEWIDVEELNLPPKGDAVDWLENNQEATIDALNGLLRITPELDQTIKPLFDIAEARVDKFVHTPPPLRRYLLDNCLPIGKVGLVVGMGGVRKSMLMMQLQISLAANKPLCGHWGIGESGASLGLYAEEDEDELHRRFYSALENFKPEAKKLVQENVHIKSMTGICTQLTEKQHFEVEMTVMAERLILTAKQIPNLKLIILDPASRFRGGDENNSSDATRFVEVCEYIAKETGATVLIVHHVNKSSISNEDASQAAARGSSALTDGVRWQMNLSVMSAKEARQYQIPIERRKYFVKCTVTKNNYAPPQEGDVWLEMQGNHGNLQYRQLFSAEEQKSEHTIKLIIRKIEENANKGVEYSISGFVKEYGGKSNIFKIGEKGLRGLIQNALEIGYLVQKQPLKPQQNVISVLAISQTAVSQGLAGNEVQLQGVM